MPPLFRVGDRVKVIRDGGLGETGTIVYVRWDDTGPDWLYKLKNMSRQSDRGHRDGFGKYERNLESATDPDLLLDEGL